MAKIGFPDPTLLVELVPLLLYFKLKSEVEMKDTLLLIDTDVIHCEALEFVLSKKGFELAVCHDAITGLQMTQVLQPDAVILDIMLPDLDGWQTCARLRDMSEVPIIVLTTLRATEAVVKGLNLGADSYLVKPVPAEELAARIRAVLRRTTRSKIKEGNGQGSLFRHEHLLVDLKGHQVTVDGQEVYLSPTEFRLLRVLVQHRGRVLPQDFLLREVWGPENGSKFDSLRLYISYLRRKIEKDATQPDLIHNEWGIGYRFG
jgi:two-component system KDP operon response regulator KdpE